MRILIYHTNHCVQCKALERRLEQFFKNSPECKEYVHWIDAEENEDDLAFYGINAAPTMICVDKSGACVWRFDGYNPRNDYEDAIFKQVKHQADCDAFPQVNRGYPKRAH